MAKSGQVMIMLDGTGEGPHPGVRAPDRIPVPGDAGPHPGVRAHDRLPVPGGVPKPGPVIVKIEDEDNDVVIVEPRGRKRPRAVDDDVVIVEPSESRRKRHRRADPPEEDAEDLIYVKTYPARP